MAVGKHCLILLRLGGFTVAGFFAFMAAAMAQPMDDAVVKGSGYSEKEAYAYSQGVIGKSVGDYDFKDSRGQPVKLSDFRGKVLIISLIYSSCAHVCPLITNQINDTRVVANKAFGEDQYSIVSIGFDTVNDTPERMRLYAGQNGVDGIKNWKFLSADAATIKSLTKDLGFIYYPASGGFEHLTQTSVLTVEGKVYRHVYGETFDLPLLIDPIKQLIFGTEDPYASVDDFVKKIRLFCTVYDPLNNTYKFDITIFVRIAAGLTVIIPMIFFVIRQSILIRRRRIAAEKEAAVMGPKLSPS
ncbi:MAG: hypothetical protein A3G18_07230 [Rhodospirillales bacterium RIFCSPLOWO2_12_FULL_58_28]|nr:MAG: hypothetical protein A3H92_09200 [Rhodospirillales bacterium RIFCSPLOWO2_02_FULL_58_16]OHC79310.1 MAG: hypothetical protein A3G18_07230 [Rhodospirillales bacterium RIFCSPLOWO2_12_FULL_58_28]